MTRDDIIRMMRQACDTDKVDAWHNDFWTVTQEELEHFAALVAAAEREAITALRAALAQQTEPVEPVAKVELMMTGGNAGLSTRIVEIYDHFRERLRPGQLLYTAPPQRKYPVDPAEYDDAGAAERYNRSLR